MIALFILLNYKLHTLELQTESVLFMRILGCNVAITGPYHSFDLSGGSRLGIILREIVSSCVCRS